MDRNNSPIRKSVVVGLSTFFVILLAGASISFAALTFTGTNITGDSNSALDATGTIQIGTSQATGITIGKSSITTTIPGTLTITSLSSSGNPCLSVSSGGTVATTTCGSGGGSATTIDGITSSTFNFLASGTGLSVSSSSNPNTIIYTWTNPGYVLTSGNNTWTGVQTFNATTTFLGPIVESSTGAGSVQLTEGTCPSGSSGNDILCADSSLHALKSSLNGSSYAAIPQLAGDLGGTAASPAVVGLQGRAVSSTAPSTNQVLTWNGSVWLPENASGTSGGGGGSGSVTTSSAITANNFPFWATTSGGLSGTSTLSASGNTITNSGNADTLGNVALGTSTLNSGANLFASYGTTGTTTLMLGATTTPRTGCIELVGDNGTTVYYLTISPAGALQISSSTCL
jgi:trimeric autotransporter adhesin